MYKPKHTKRHSCRHHTKAHVMVAAIVLMLGLIIGGTVAWLIDVTDPVQNVFMPTDVTCYVYEEISGNQKTAIRIQNTGSIDAYIRVAVALNYVNADGHICAAHNAPALPAPGSGWTQGANGIYYYSNEVSPGGYTAPLFGGAVTLDSAGDGCVLQMEIIADAIQAAGGAKADATANYAW